MRRISPRFPKFLTTALLVCCSFAWAQRPQARLKTITDTSRLVLAGSHSPHADRGQDLGAVSPATAIPGITLVFKRSAAQQEALDELLVAQQNPASPLYHRWLTPDTFAARFGIAEADITATETWLQSHGFHIDNAGRDRLTFSGTAAQVQSAFRADLHHYQVEGERHFAPASDLTLPAELAPLTAAVLHLSDFRPKPSVIPQSSLQPAFTSMSTEAHYLTPDDILSMYGMASLSYSFQGDGQGIAIVGQSYVDTSPSSRVAQFLDVATATQRQTTRVLVPGSGVEAISPGDQGESEIDIEYATGIAPRSGIFLVFVGANKNYSVFDSIDFAITQNIAPVISISYGVCESLMSATELNQDNALFQQANAQGQTIVAASGDNGSTACANYPASSGVTAAQEQALAVSFPASSPYVTAVGGTEMAAGTFGAGANTYWLSSAATDSIHTLLSYVPEVVWNEGTAARGIIASGGGASGYFPQPSWQSGLPGIVPAHYRMVPDIALQSSIRSPGFLLCSSDSSLAGPQTSCANGLLASNGQYTIAGGTSFATPIVAGMVAVLNQIKQTSGQGNVSPQLYTLASNPATYGNVFHDITLGSNACAPGASSCAAAGESGYSAVTGYDEATGLGSFDFGKLVAAWPAGSASALTGTTLGVDNLPPTATAGSVIPITIAVTSIVSGTAAGPSGTIAISVDGTVVQAAAILTPTSVLSSLASYTFTAPATAGSHIVSATYKGDGTHGPSSGSASILVGNVVPSGSFALAANNLAVTNGGTGTDQVTIMPTGYSGRLTWSLSITSSNTATALTACYGIGSPAVNGASTATLTIGVGAACGSTSSSGSVRTMVSRTTPPSEEGPWRSAPRVGLYAGVLALGLFGLRRKRRGVPNLFAAVLFAMVAAGLAGCGGSSNNTVSGTVAAPPVAAATVYTLTLKGTDSVNTSITASTTFTLTVN